MTVIDQDLLTQLEAWSDEGLKRAVAQQEARLQKILETQQEEMTAKQEEQTQQLTAQIAGQQSRGFVKVMISGLVTLAVAGAAASIGMVLSHDTKIAVIETQMTDLDDDMDSMDRKLDALLIRFNVQVPELPPKSDP